MQTDLWLWLSLSIGNLGAADLHVLKEISPKYSLEGLMLKLKLPTLDIGCEELTHWKRP